MTRIVCLMTDGAKCLGTREGVACPRKNGCRRYTAPISGCQWWMDCPLRPDGGCVYFIEDTEKKVQEAKNG